MDSPTNETPCPICGGEVRYYPTCHTYGIDGRWMACISCDSAIEYMCINEDNLLSHWSYIDGLNPRNPRAEVNAANRPKWLDDGFVDNLIHVDNRVKYLGDD